MALHEVDIWNRALSRVGDARLVPEASVAITSATAANPVVVTTGVHGYLDDELVLIRANVEMTEVNGRVFKINVLSTTTFELLEEDGSSYTAEATGGTVQRLPGAKRSKATFDAWDNIRDEVLESHPWANCTKRTRAARLNSAFTITAATGANPVVITTSAAHGYSVNDDILIEAVAGMTELNDRWFRVASPLPAPTNTFELSGEDGTTHTAYSSGGTVKKARTPFVPDSGYGARYALPSDHLRVVELTGSRALWMVENGELHTDESLTVPIQYIFRQRDVTQYRPALVNTLAYRLALELNEELTQSGRKRENALREWELFLSRSKHTDSLEQSAKPIEEDEWILSRLSGSVTARRFDR